MVGGVSICFYMLPWTSWKYSSNIDRKIYMKIPYLSISMRILSRKSMLYINPFSSLRYLHQQKYYEKETGVRNNISWTKIHAKQTLYSRVNVSVVKNSVFRASVFRVTCMHIRWHIVQRAFDETLSQACIVYKRLTFIVRLKSPETFSVRLRSSKRLSTMFCFTIENLKIS
jgi:hypothetical protein